MFGTKKKISAGIAFAVSLASYDALAEPCSTSSADGGLMSITLRENFSPSEWGGDNSWRAIAEQVQEDFGNQLAHDTPTGDVHITFDVRVAGIPGPMPPLLVSFSGNRSIEKEILDNRGIDLDQPDPNKCEPVSEGEGNGEGDSDSGGSVSGGGGGGGYAVNPGTGIPAPAFPSFPSSPPRSGQGTPGEDIIPSSGGGSYGGGGYGGGGGGGGSYGV